MLTKNMMYYGVDEVISKLIPLRAGPLNLFFENNGLRYIHYGEHEIIRRVYVAVRDRNWDTVPSQVSNLKLEVQEDSFRINLEMICQQDEIDFRWLGQIEGWENGCIQFSMYGQAYTEFWRNRIGFCVLYPIEGCAGQPCEIEKVDGSLEWAQFPLWIAPHQPFKDLRAISHQVAPGVKAEVRLEGDIFEMEDQRNWSDFSFKTYSTPLALPFPVKVKIGERVAQKVQLQLKGEVVRVDEVIESCETVDISISPELLKPFPLLGLGIASHENPLSPTEIERLRVLNLHHLRVDLHLGTPTWHSQLERAIHQAHAIGIQLEIGLHLSNDPKGELESIRELINHWNPEVARWLVYHQEEPCTDLKWVNLAREVLGSYGEWIPFGCGAYANFTELNRGLKPEALSLSLSHPDFLVYAVNPQVHAIDNLSLVENLAGLGSTVRSAKRIAGDRAVVVSPVTLKPRFNVVATEPQRKPDPNRLPPTVDPRQMSLFGAGWTLGALKYLAENSTQSATFYETTGWRGVMEAENGSPMPGLFRSIPGMVFPLYHIFADVGAFTGGFTVVTKSSNPLKAVSLAIQEGDHLGVWVANLEAGPSQIHILNLPRQVQVKILDEDNFLEAVQAPTNYRRNPGQLRETENGCLRLALKPYAIVRIEIQGELR